MNTPAYGPYNPDPHSPYGRQLQQRLRAHAGPRAEETETGNRVTRAFKAVFTELESATAGPPPVGTPGTSPPPSSSHLANASEDFFARLDAGVRELVADTERATERLGFTQRRPAGPPPGHSTLDR